MVRSSFIKRFSRFYRFWRFRRGRRIIIKHRRVSPLGGSVHWLWMKASRELEIRNEKWWCGARSFDSVLTVPPLHDRTSDISLRSGWRNAPRSINNGNAMSWHASHLRHLIPSYSSLLANFWGIPFPYRHPERSRGIFLGKHWFNRCQILLLNLYA